MAQGWGEWVETPDSTNVLRFRFFEDELDPALNSIEVVFDPVANKKPGGPRSGKTRTYRYVGPGRATFAAFREAPGKGQFVSRHLIPHYQAIGPY